MTISPQMMNLTIRLSEMMPPDKLTVARSRDHNTYRRDCFWAFVSNVIMLLGVVNHQTHYNFRPLNWLVAGLAWVHVVAGVALIVFAFGAAIIIPVFVLRRYEKGSEDWQQAMASLKRKMLQYRIHFAQIFMNLLWVAMVLFSGHHIIAYVTLALSLMLHGGLIASCYVGPRFINVQV